MIERIKEVLSEVGYTTLYEDEVNEDLFELKLDFYRKEIINDNIEKKYSYIIGFYYDAEYLFTYVYDTNEKKYIKNKDKYSSRRIDNLLEKIYVTNFSKFIRESLINNENLICYETHAPAEP